MANNSNFQPMILPDIQKLNSLYRSLTDVTNEYWKAYQLNWKEPSRTNNLRAARLYELSVDIRKDYIAAGGRLDTVPLVVGSGSETRYNSKSKSKE